MLMRRSLRLQTVRFLTCLPLQNLLIISPIHCVLSRQGIKNVLYKHLVILICFAEILTIANLSFKERSHLYIAVNRSSSDQNAGGLDASLRPSVVYFFST
jgi:hypothetical protein